MDKFDKWLMAGAEDGAESQDRIDEEITRLMHSEYDPDNFNNFVEAIGEDCLVQHKDTIEEALRNNDKALLGLVVSCAVYEYWEKKATEDAQDQESQGLL
jgi:hypothetical protein